MASEYYLNGVPLDDPAGRWFVTSETLLPSVSAPRNVSVTVPLRSGVLPVPAYAVDPFQVTVKMVVQDNGQGRARLDYNFMNLMRTVRPIGDFLMMQWRVPGMPGRQARVRLSASVEPTFYYLENMIEVALVFEGIDGMWRDEREQTMVSSNLSLLSGSTLPITDAVIDLVGYGRTVEIVDVPSGLTMRWDRQNPNTEHLIIDCATYEVHGSDVEFEASGPDLGAALTVPPRGFQLTPDATGAFSMRVTNTGTAKVRARRAY